MWGYFYDYYYIVLVVPAIIISLIAQINVKATFSKYSKVGNSRGITGAEAAKRILSNSGINNVSIELISGKLTDHYDPKANVIRLSDSVYNSKSVAAIGVACHEAGHAIQYAENYSPVKLRNAIIPVSRFGSGAGVWLAIIGIAMGWQPLVIAGIVLFSAVVVFQLLTLPVEFNASRRALRAIDESDILYGDERKGAKKMLRAAALTYVAALLVSVMTLLRLILQSQRRR